jgi:hypothetical protein
LIQISVQLGDSRVHGSVLKPVDIIPSNCFNQMTPKSQKSKNFNAPKI